MTRAFGIRSSLGWSGYNWQSRSVVVVDTNPVPSLYGWYFMNCITAFDSLMHVVPTKILQDCKKFLSGGKCKYKYDSIAAITKQLEPVQMKPFRLPLRDKATLDVILQLKSKIELPIVAKFSDNSTLPLSSNFGYLESKLFDSKEFLMTKESVESGEHLTSLMARHGMNHSIYGPETLKVLEEIGWPTRRRPQNIQFVLSKLQPPVVSQQFPENP